MKLAVWSTAGRGFVTTPLALVLLVGCPQTSTRVVSQSAVLGAVDVNYEISRTERPPKDTIDNRFPPGHSVPDDSAPSMTIATMSPITPSPLFRILARITSSGKFPPMGIEPGKNYLWRNLSDSTVWITPANGGPNKRLVNVPGYVFRPMPGHEPGLRRVKVNSTAFVACLEGCPSGHCGMF